MATAIEVAETLIWLAARDGETLTNLRLQKLLYFVQGWSLARRGRVMFPEDIRAFENGPVVNQVLKRFQCGDAPIPAEHVRPGVEGLELRFVNAVWSEYRVFTASELWRMTHNEEPYIRNYRPYDGTGLSPVMPPEEIQAAFENRRERPITQEQAEYLSHNYAPPAEWSSEEGAGK